MKAINNYITIRPMEAMREGIIHLPQTQTQKCLYGVVTSIGEKVKNKSIMVDSVVSCDSTQLKSHKGSFLISEDSIQMIRNKNIWRPLGRKILLQRMNDEIKTDGGIIVPSCYKSSDQSLHCVFIRNGILDGEVYDPDFGLFCGDVVRLAKWEHHIREIEIDGVFHLIVKPSDILYTTHEDADVSNRIIS